MFGIHPDLQRRTALVAFVSLGSGAVGLLILWGHFTGAPDLREVPLPVVIVAATFSLLVAYLGIFATPRWYRDASIAFESATPINGTLILRIDEDSDTRSLTGHVDLATGDMVVGQLHNIIEVIFGAADVQDIDKSGMGAGDRFKAGHALKLALEGPFTFKGTSMNDFDRAQRAG